MSKNSMGGAALAALLKGAFESDTSGSNSAVDTCQNTMKSDKVLQLLKQAAKNYAEQPFQIGHIVTVRQGVNLRSHAVPAIVVDVLPIGVYRDNLTDYQGSQNKDDKALVDRDVGNGYPIRNVRVLSLRNDVIMPMWFEAFQLEHWTEEHQKLYDEAIDQENE